MSNEHYATQTLKAVIDLFSNKALLTDFMAKGFIETAGKPSDKWSLGNKLCMLLGETTDARGYNQWQQAGRQVRKGSRAIYILAPLVGKRKETDKYGKETEIVFVYGFKAIPVFRIEDTDISDAKLWESQSFKPRVVPPLMDTITKLGIKVTYQNTHSGEFGTYNQNTDTIKLCTEDQGTLFHELGHAIHKRILAKTNEKLKPGQDKEQEVIAELFAAVVARLYNIKYDSFAWTYISSYVGDQKPESVGRACLKVASTVEQMLNYLFEVKREVAPAATA